ncbi:unnamed protein product [Clonostachys rosea]|uniref:Nucleoside phosphorylase domain-containing protein n=1 Tax=Bionectria ochroleuca TaxID=29856 RepID=A0ABY6V310_BIOOC|nr:unnamed protein product [Clonostachys rosea]
MSEQTPLPTEYTVGCICPPSMKMAPVLAMLDEKHEPHTTSQPNQNAYTLGTIAGHKVVIAVLPAFGTTAAARVASQLMNDFPSVRFGFLVGIGGGIPGDDDGQDIRLGDVVVSLPTATFGGVVQFDLGKRYPNGRFERTGHLNKPPDVLCSHIRLLQAHHLMVGSKILDYVQEMFTRHPKMKARYKFPSREKDRLFEASYIHHFGRTCDSCDPSKTVPRDDRPDDEPQVHYGTIGSANTVLKNAKVRDELRRDMGLLCVETEGAGLMDTLPCVLIRGICDYADGHKNKQWQPYAAAVAAAYMKELLATIPPFQILHESPAKDVAFSDVRTHELLEQSNQLHNELLRAFEKSTVLLMAQQEHNKAEEERRCHQVFKTSPYERYKNSNPERVDNTCRWVLEHEQFLEWKDSARHDLLWISADPGCGKSALSRSLIDRDFKEHSVCYFFFKDNERQDDLATALCAIIHQLFDNKPALVRHALPSWRKNREGIRQETEGLWNIFLSAATDPMAKPTICVLDALDECREEDRRQLISKLCHSYQSSDFTSPETPLKFIVTSRPYDSVQRWFEQMAPGSSGIRLRGEDQNDKIRDEIKLVIDQHVNDLAAEFDLSRQITEKLRQDLKQMQHRTYLWLSLAMDEIRETCRDSIFVDEIQIESLPKPVEDNYERILGRVKPKQKDYTRRILSIVLAARRPLTITEMAGALGAARADELGQLSIDEINGDRLEKQIRELCGLFIFINHSNLFLIHPSAREFLVADGSHPSHEDSNVWKSSFHEREMESLMARLCVTYICLSHEQYSKGPGDSFFEYCSEHWISHLQQGYEEKIDSQLIDKMLSLHTTHEKCFNSWFPVTSESLAPWQSIPNLLMQHAASMADHGIAPNNEAHKHKTSVHAKEEDSRAAAHSAAESPRAEAVEMLLDAGVEITPEGRGQSTVLLESNCSGHERTLQVQVDNGVDIKGQG